MTTLDFVNAPLATANFIRIAEGKAPQPGGGRGGPPPGMGGGGRGGRGAEVPPIGQILETKGGLAAMQIVSDVQKSVAIPKLPKTTNKALKHDAAGVIGLSGPNTFYLTLQKKGNLDGKYRRDRQGHRRRRPSAGPEEGRADPQHPHHARGPGRARLQDGRRGVREADEEVARGLQPPGHLE